MTPGASSRRTPSRPIVYAALVAALGLVGIALIVARPGPTASPTSTPGALVADLAPLAHDDQISDGDLLHDSRDDLYRTPVGPVPSGTRVTVRLRAAAGDLTAADVLIRDRTNDLNAVAPMHIAATDGTGGAHGYDYWEATVRTFQPAILEYQFVARDGQAVSYVSDSFDDGGTGDVYPAAQETGAWQLTVYDPAFTTPAWTRGAVAYQIFPDRFRDGNPANNPVPNPIAAATAASPYVYGDVYGNPVLPKAWDQLPEGYCRAYQGVTCPEAPLGRDFFGGDLAGITASLDELADLGVTVLYLNPIFAAPSNHRYDTSDYLTIDPDLGTQADFDALVAGAKAHGMHLVLDGVFNHVSSDSPWFDRAHRYAAVGACESASSPYRSWFTFRAPSGNEPAPCAPSTKGGSDTYYVGWAGFDTIPELVEGPQVNQLINGDGGVVQHWLAAGADGWRLDVMDNLSHPFLKGLRAAAKAANPDALVLGEQWGDSSDWLLGSEADSVMNYRFRRAAIGLINGATPDLDGSIEALPPSAFVSQMQSVQEDYPPAAFNALLNLVDSHDTTRILWTMTPGADNDAAKAEAAAVAEGKAKVREVAVLQLSWPGMASIYYGDEVGLSGQDDPDDRRPYPWGHEDTDLRSFYRTLARLRGDHAALREGDLRFLLAEDASASLAFARTTPAEAIVTVMNLGTTARDVTVDVRNVIPDGLALADAIGGPGATVSAGKVTVSLAARGSAVLITPQGADLAAPTAPAAPTAQAGRSSVTLGWQAVEGAASYRVFRSLVSGGGEQPIGDTGATSYTDTSVRNGSRYYYRVAAIDAAGNLSAQSDEVAATPQLLVANALLEGGATAQQPVSAAGGPAMTVAVTAPGSTDAPGAVVGLRLELGLGPVGSDASGTDWTWRPMRFDADSSAGDRFTGSVAPEAPGTYVVAARFSTDAGETWTLVDRDGSANGFSPDQGLTLTAVAPADREPPAAPGVATVTNVSGTAITIGWPAVAAPDLFRYRVSRADAPGGARAFLGFAMTPTYTDDSVQSGATYVYVVTAQDRSFNESAESPELAIVAEKRVVQVTFTATVPNATPAGDTIYIAGDFQAWNPGATAMTRVDATHWAITLPFEDGAHPQYKYTRGTWDAVEKDAGCGEVPNRTVLVAFGSAGAQPVADAVLKWRDIAHCG